VSLVLQVNFNDIVKKHSLVKPIKARIVRIELPGEEDGKKACIKVELHGIIKQESSGNNYVIYYSQLVKIPKCEIYSSIRYACTCSIILNPKIQNKLNNQNLLINFF
jgi:hypothetical protein